MRDPRELHQVRLCTGFLKNKKARSPVCVTESLSVGSRSHKCQHSCDVSVLKDPLKPGMPHKTAARSWEGPPGDFMDHLDLFQL